jgi:serine/threonine-protein kinase HipA
MSDELCIYLGNRRIARLDGARGRMELRYEVLDGPALSVRLPPRAEPYDDEACHWFFANLLPEGSWRDSLCRQLHIAPGDDFALLAAIGAECAGAVALRPEPDWTPAAGHYRPITEAELARWVKSPATRPRADVTPGMRFSLAGAQEKLVIHLEDGAAYLCEGGAPSTVILKPDIRDPMAAIELSALNELLSMALASRAGIAVPRSFWFASAFAVERYDRERQGKTWLRVHQEDFAQVLGLAPAAKYSVGWNQCFEIASTFTAVPSIARLQLLDRLLFDLVLGNCDAHAKNFSLVHDAAVKPRLAPAYDLVCTALYPALSTRFAMPIGPARTLAELEPAAWQQFAASVSVRLPFVRRRAAEIANRSVAALNGLITSLEIAHPALRTDIYPARRRADLFRRFSDVIQRNASRLTESLEP